MTVAVMTSGQSGGFCLSDSLQFVQSNVWTVSMSTGKALSALPGVHIPRCCVVCFSVKTLMLTPPLESFLTSRRMMVFAIRRPLHNTLS